MRPVHAALVALLVWAHAGAVRGQDCPGCYLGLYDDSLLTRTTGFAAGESKVLYLGIRYSSIAPAELTGIELGISGLGPFLVSFQTLDDATVVLGSPEFDQFGRGGVNVAWGTCLLGDRALMKIRLTPRFGWPPEATFIVRGKVPPSNPYRASPIITRCDAPYYTSVGVTGGSFALGGPGVPACSVQPGVDFGSVEEGESAVLQIPVQNTGTGVLSGRASLDCPDFALVDAEPSFALARNETRTFTVSFTPTRPGEQSCDLLLGTVCPAVRLVGRTVPLLPIAVLHQDPGKFFGQKVIVEGQPYIPTNYTGVPGIGWIQDDSGRGVQLYGSGAATPLLYDPRNRVRVHGTVGHSDATLRIQDITAVTLSSAGNPPLAPALLLTGSAAHFSWEGTFVQVSGTVVERSLTAEGVRYVLDDGTGRIAALVHDALGAAVFGTDQPLTARGAAGSENGEFVLRVGSALDIFLSGSGSCLGRRLVVDNVRGTVGSQVDIPVRMQWNPIPIDAFGFRLAYDGAALRFLGADCCDLSGGWVACEARPVGRDTLVVGGFNDVPIQANSIGTLMCLRFEVLQCGGAHPLRVFDLVDDLAGMNVCDGTYACTDCLADGDVNRDQMLSPGDAQCAFQIFLNAQVPPSECDFEGTCESFAADVNCSGAVTPGDALGIFRRWLSGDVTPQDCFARSLAATAGPGRTPATGALYRLDASAAHRIGPDRVAVPLEMRAGSGPAAFAVQVEHDPASARFVELLREPGARAWPGLAAHATQPGHLLVGGFDPGADSPAALAASDWAPIAQLVFQTAGTVQRWSTKWIEQILMDGPGERGFDPAAVRPWIGTPRPNPARGEVVLDVGVPGQRDVPVGIEIHDVLGRRIAILGGNRLAPGAHTLRWDRTDARGEPVAAGIYVFQVQIGDRLERRKVVVLR